MENPAISLNGPEDTQRALLDLVDGIQRSLHLYTPYVEPRLYNDNEVLDAIRAKIVERPRLRFQLLLPPAASWRRSCPRLLHLLERLSSAMELRTLGKNEPRERPEFAQEFMIADQTALLHLADPRRCLGSHDQAAFGKARELLNFFTEIWEKSQPDPELRRLRL